MWKPQPYLIDTVTWSAAAAAFPSQFIFFKEMPKPRMMYTHTLKRKGRYLNAEGNSKGKRRKEIVSSRARTRVEREKKNGTRKEIEWKVELLIYLRLIRSHVVKRLSLSRADYSLGCGLSTFILARFLFVPSAYILLVFSFPLVICFSRRPATFTTSAKSDSKLQASCPSTARRRSPTATRCWLRWPSLQRSSTRSLSSARLTDTWKR